MNDPASEVNAKLPFKCSLYIGVSKLDNANI